MIAACLSDSGIEKMKMTRKIEIVLLHGTIFFRKPLWIFENTNSKFRKKLENRLGAEVKFKTHTWSGRNLQNQRKVAGQRLAQSLSEVSDTKSPNAKSRFIIGHSHGGNVAIYAADTLENSRRDAITGIICMNTPFFLPIWRNVKHALSKVENSLLGFFITLAIFIQAGKYIGNEILKPLISHIQDFIGIHEADIVILFVILLFITIIIIIPSRKIRFIDDFSLSPDYIFRLRDDLAEEMKLPKIKTPILSMTTSGDEVYTVFNILRSIANLPFIFTHPLIILLLLTSIAAREIYVIFDYKYFYELYQYITFHIRELKFLVILQDTLNFLWIAVIFAFLVNLAAATILACLFVASLVANVFIFWLFGISYLHLPGSLGVSIINTVAPIGPTAVEFQNIDIAAAKLSHSEVYESDEVIDAIADWINRQTGSEPNE